MNIKKIITLIAAVIIIAAAGYLISNTLALKDEKISDNSVVVSSEQNDQNVPDNQTDTVNDKTRLQESNTKKASAEKLSETNSKNSKGNVSESIRTSQNADTDGPTTEQAVAILSDFYGSTYRVETAEYNNGYQKFNITDKKGNAYASVKVELSSGEATEKIIQTNEVNEYNLLV